MARPEVTGRKVFADQAAFGGDVGSVHRLLGLYGAAEPRSRSGMDQLTQPGLQVIRRRPVH
jgi:hypothetical protein